MAITLKDSFRRRRRPNSTQMFLRVREFPRGLRVIKCKAKVAKQLIEIHPERHQPGQSDEIVPISFGRGSSAQDVRSETPYQNLGGRYEKEFFVNQTYETYSDQFLPAGHNLTVACARSLCASHDRRHQHLEAETCETEDATTCDEGNDSTAVQARGGNGYFVMKVVP
jgi:hypothetical protein